MAITINHTYCTAVEITFDDDFNTELKGTMDFITECVLDAMVSHNFTTADVTSATTGELLMQIERT